MTKAEKRKLWVQFGKDWLAVMLQATYGRQKKTGKHFSLLSNQNLIVKLIEKRGYMLRKIKPSSTKQD